MNPLLRTPWYYGWNIVAAGMATQAIIFGIYIYSFTLWVAPWTTEFGIGRSEVMVVFLTVQVTSALFAPIAGRALDRFPIRNLMLIGAVCFSAALALAASVTSFWQISLIYGLLMVVGLGWAGTVPAATLVARWFGRRRGMAMGISTVGTSIGGLLLPPLVASLLAQFGWREANLILGVIALFVISLAAMVVYNSPDEASLEHEGQAAQGDDLPEHQSAREWSVRDALTSRIFWAVGLSFLLLSFAITAVQQNLAPIGEDAGLEQTQIAWFISVMAMVMIIAKLGIGFLSDRLSYRFLLGMVTVLMALTLGILAYFEASSLSFLAVTISLGIGLGGMLPMLGVIVADKFGPASFGRIQGLLILVMLPAALGPLTAASIADYSGSYQMAWLILMVLLVPAALCVYAIAPNQRPPEPDNRKTD